MINTTETTVKGKIFVGDAHKCLMEAFDLCYAYFSPELDNFEGKIKVEDILFKVLYEIDALDSPHEQLREHAENADLNYNTNRNRAWRKKAIAFLNKWADETATGDPEPFKSMK